MQILRMYNKYGYICRISSPFKIFSNNRTTFVHTN